MSMSFVSFINMKNNQMVAFAFTDAVHYVTLENFSPAIYRVGDGLKNLHNL